MRTFASTAIPIVNTIPAMPGSVSTAPNPDKIPNIKTIFKIKAMLEYNPAFP